MNTKKTISLLLAGMVATALCAQQVLQEQMFNLSQVEITDGPFLHAMRLNDSVLLSYDRGRLMQPFEKQAGLPQSGVAYSNWSGGVGSGLDGHVGGHYLSALAMSYAACHDEAMKQRLKNQMDWFINRLKDCQDSWNGKSVEAMKGYVGGVPESQQVWTTLANNNYTLYKSSWVPFYNVHKIMAGLRDAWVYASDSTALEMFLQTADWSINLIGHISDANLQSLLDTEHGGMNEVLADAYHLTGEKKYLDAAKRYSHKWLLDGMAASNTSTLNNRHANTQVPKAIGFERIYQEDHSTTYGKAATFFWKDVVEKRTIAIGGNSVNEWFPAPTEYENFITRVEGVETCNSYNMLKLSEDLFNDTHDSKYADFYEGTLFNHILSTQHPTTGGYVYFTPERPQHYRVYSQIDQAMWCCVGSGMENHSKYGSFIYTHKGDTLYVNLFIPSRLDWAEKAVQIEQSTDFPFEQSTSVTVKTDFNGSIAIRKPSWCNGFSIKLNGQAIGQTKEENGYVILSQSFSAGDRIDVSLPMEISVVPLPNYTDYVAFKYGPILLGAKTSQDNLVGLYADDSRMGHVASGQQKNLYSAPLLIGERAALKDAIHPLDTSKLTFCIEGYYNNTKFDSLVLEPFNGIHDSRYMMYWMNITEDKWEDIREEVEELEKEQMRLEERTIDYVVTGTQQSENDHFMQQSTSESGIYNGEYYRHATPGNWFSYQLTTKAHTDSVSLMLRFWGGDKRTFDVYVDDVKLTTVTLAGDGSAFIEKEYPIPSEQLDGKEYIRVKFVASSTTYAGGIYYIRLLTGYDPDRRTKTPYRFVCSEYGIGDAARTKSVSYDSGNNTLTLVQKSRGNNNISVQMLSKASDKYSILPSQYLFTIKGTSLSTSSSTNYLWWLNGANKGSQVAPTYTAKDEDGGTLILWDLRRSGLTQNMNFNGDDEIVIGNYGASFINCWGMTSTQANLSSTISDINYYTPQEAVDKYHVLSTVLHIEPSATEAVVSDKKVDDTQAYDLYGRPVSTSQGFYIHNGKKYIQPWVRGQVPDPAL